MTVEWDGVERPLPQLQPFLKSPDRAVRERAFRAGDAAVHRGARRPGRPVRPDVRAAAAARPRNAGFANFRDYIFPAKFRFDYTPADCERFHEAVERTAAPAVARIMEHRRQRLGLDALRPWDLAVDPYRAAPLRPFETVDQFVGAARRGLRPGRPGARRPVPDHDRRAAARSRQPEGQGARRVLRDAPLPRAAVHLHERRRAGGRRDDAAARGGARVPRLRLAPPAAHLAAPPRLGGGGAGVDVDGAARLAAPGAAAPGTSRPRTTVAPGSSTWRTCCSAWSHIASVDAFQTWIYTSPDGADAVRARRGVAPDPEPVRARRGLERARARAGGALVPPAPHLHVPVLLHRVRHRPDRRAPDLAQQPATIRRRGARYREALALGAVRTPARDVPGGRCQAHASTPG